MHVLYGFFFDGSGLMPVALSMCPRYCISLEKKLHLLFFIERFADFSFSKTILICDKCSCGVLLKMMMSSKYAIANGKSLKIPVISS